MGSRLSAGFQVRTAADLYTASLEMPWRKWRVYFIACFRSETCNDVSLAAIPRVRDPSGAEEKFRFPFAVYDRGRIAAEHGSCYTGDGRRGSCSLRFSSKAVISVVIFLKQYYFQFWKGAGRLLGLGSNPTSPSNKVGTCNLALRVFGICRESPKHNRRGDIGKLAN